MKLVVWIRKHWVISSLAFVFLFIIGIPLIINCSYSGTPILITHWNAADVLGYYGDVLGAFVTVGVLAITIICEKETARQQAHVHMQKENWKRTEEIIDATLNTINPTRLVNICNNSIIDLNGLTTEGVSRVYSEFSNYLSEIRSCVDMLLVHVEANEHDRVVGLVETISNTADKCLEVAKGLHVAIQESYMNQLVVTNMSSSKRIQNDVAAMCNMKNSTDLAAKLLKAIEGLNDLHKNEYCNLIKDKVQCFIEVYSSLVNRD